MATLSVSYRDLKNAGSQAGQVAKRLGDYADSLQSNVINKLNNYSGDWTSNVSTAKSQTQKKINDLRTEQNKYSTLATELTELQQVCESTDVAVRQRVSTLTGDFKKANGIRSNDIEDAISRFLNSLINETAVGRWLRSKIEEFQSATEYFKDCIRDWYNYDGGKELLTGIATFILEVGIALLGIAIAIAGFSFTILGILSYLASFVLFSIAILDASTNLSNEVKAYSRRSYDPATAKRLSDLNTAADTLESSFMFGDDGETYIYDEENNALAKGLRIAKFVADIIKLVDGGKKLFENAGKWLTGNADFKLGELISKNGLKDLMKGIGNKLTDFKLSFHLNQSEVQKIFNKILNSSLKNLENKYLDFSGVKDGLSSLKSILSFGKDILDMSVEGKFDLKDIYNNLIGPAIGLVNVPNKDGDHKMITLDDISSKIDKIIKLSKVSSSLDDTTIKKSCLEKLQEKSIESISIHPVNIPSFSI